MASVPEVAQIPDAASLFEAAPEAIVVTDQGGVIVLINHQAEIAFGYDRGELIGRPVDVVVPETLSDYHRQHHDRSTSDPQVRPTGPGPELRARRKDGSEFPIEVTLGPVVSNGELLTSAVIHDLTRVRREGRLFRALVEAAPDATVVADQTGRIILVNSRLEDLFGYQRDELLGRRIEILVPDRHAGQHVARRAGYMARPTARPMGPTNKLVARRKDASEFPVEIALAPVESDEGTLVIASIRDITDRLRLEESEELYRVKDEFFATVSHELRTPLAAIIGYAEILDDAGELSPECQGFLEVLMRNAQRELRLVEDLLTLVNVEESGMSLHTAPAELQRVVGDCVRTAILRADELGLTMYAHLPEDPIIAAVDAHRIGQALDNLVSNALKFTPTGGSVSALLSEDVEGIHIDVRDSGPGIDESDRHRIFERLYRSSRAINEQIPGAGLGLAITLAVVEAHGGTLEVHDTSSTGTTMRITLPSTASRPEPIRPLARP